MQEWGCWALRNLVRTSNAIREAVIEQDGIGVILSGMRAHRLEIGVQEWGCGVLRNITVNNETSPAVIANKVTCS